VYKSIMRHHVIETGVREDGQRFGC